MNINTILLLVLISLFYYVFFVKINLKTLNLSLDNFNKLSNDVDKDTTANLKGITGDLCGEGVKIGVKSGSLANTKILGQTLRIPSKDISLSVSAPSC